MNSPRLLALVATLSCLLVCAASAEAAVPLADTELAQVHAAGLPDAALQNIALAVVPGMDLAAAHELSSSAEREQSLALARFASGIVQASVGLMRSATLPTLFTPLAPLFLPALAMPFPPLMAPPPKKH